MVWRGGWRWDRLFDRAVGSVHIQPTPRPAHGALSSDHTCLFTLLILDHILPPSLRLLYHTLLACFTQAGLADKLGLLAVDLTLHVKGAFPRDGRGLHEYLRSQLSGSSSITSWSTPHHSSSKDPKNWNGNLSASSRADLTKSSPANWPPPTSCATLGSRSGSI